MAKPNRLGSYRDAHEIDGLSRSARFNLRNPDHRIYDPDYPPSIVVGGRSLEPLTEIEEWVERKIAQQRANPVKQRQVAPLKARTEYLRAQAAEKARKAQEATEAAEKAAAAKEAREKAKAARDAQPKSIIPPEKAKAARARLKASKTKPATSARA